MQLPAAGHNRCRMISGSAQHRTSGLAVAFKDDFTRCGATLKAACPPPAQVDISRLRVGFMQGRKSEVI
jgi:uncharacterized Zn-binding protein involved in type VI secretion